MIVRRSGPDLLLITQPDHAALAGRIMTAWQADGFPLRPRRDRVLDATRLHDIGWQELDSDPTIDPESGAPHGFMDAPLHVRQGVWPRALDLLAPRDRYVAALVGQHARTVYGRFQQTPGWESFFTAMDRRRDDLLRAEGVDHETMLEDYAIVGMGHLWSLIFCNGWRDSFEFDKYRAQLHNDSGHDWLRITPDPFDGETIALDVSARRLASRAYASDKEFRDEFAAAPVLRLTGRVSG